MNAGPYDFSVIIPVFNKWELTEACLRSLQKHTPECRYEVIVVDNGSSDDTVRKLDPLGQQLFGCDFRSIRFAENRNFGPGCNAGAQAAAAPLLFFLNNDTLLTPAWAPPLLRAFSEYPALGGAGPLLLYEDNTVQHVGVTFTAFHVVHLYRHFPGRHPVIRRPRNVQALTAAALMLPKDVFFAVGAFHEAYHNGFEDVDLCLHIVKHGKALMCIPDSVIYHLESQTPGRKGNETHNAAVLKERCGSLFHADEHLHGLRDGFRPFLGDDLDISLGMSEEQDASLGRQASGQPLEYWRKLMLEHPLWTGGREYFAGLAEKQKQWDLALLLRSELAFRRKRVSDYISLIATAEMAGDASALATAKKTLEYLVATKNDIVFARKGLRLARAWGDRVLENLYADRVKEIRESAVLP